MPPLARLDPDELLLQAFLQRVVNSGGRIEREYGSGRGRTDLLLVWPRAGAGADADAPPGGGAFPDGPAPVDKVVIECKVLHGGLDRTIAEGLEQTAAYVDRCAAREGHPVIVDRAAGRSRDEKIFHRRESGGGAQIDVWGM